jgi:type IV pilus assembly protein PilW
MSMNRLQMRSSLKAKGFTLIELMISIALGLIVLSALIALFVNNSSTRRELDRSAEVLENGAYAIGYLRDELSMAGYLGTLDVVTGTATDTSCSTVLADWAGSLAVHVRGGNHTGADPFSTCGFARKSGTDTIFIQRAATCTTGATASDCETMIGGLAYLQVSECGTEFATTPSILALGTASNFTLKTKACTGTAPIRRLVRRFFYINANGQLVRRDVTPGSILDEQVIADGIDNLQFEYAIDTNGDGAADKFSYAPLDAEWPGVIGVRVFILARSLSESRGYKDDKKYNLADWALTTPSNDAFRRRVFSTYVNFVNPQGRLE